MIVIKIIINWSVIIGIGVLISSLVSKRGKDKKIKNINFFTDKGNSLPIAILKSALSGYGWIFRMQAKLAVIVFMAIFASGDGNLTAEELEEEEEEYLRMQEEKRKLEEELYWMEKEKQ